MAAQCIVDLIVTLSPFPKPHCQLGRCDPIAFETEHLSIALESMKSEFNEGF